MQCRLDDAQICLMRNQPVQLLCLNARLRADLGHIAAKGRHCKLVDLFAVHLQKRLLWRQDVKGTVGRRLWDTQHLRVPFCRQMDALQRIALAQQNSACTVPEQHTGRTVVPVHQAAHRVACQHQHLLDLLSGKIAGCHIQRIHKPGTRRRNIHRRTACTQLLLNHTRLRRGNIFSPDGRAQNQVQLLWLYSCPLERLLSCDGQQVSQRFIAAQRALADAGALANPLVTGIQKGGQVVVCLAQRRQRASG